MQFVVLSSYSRSSQSLQDSMNRSAQNLPPNENWRSRQDSQGVYLSTHSSGSGTRPLFPPYVPARVVLVHHIYRQIPGEEVQEHWPLFQERVITTSSPFEVARVPGGVHYIPSQTLIPDNESTTSNTRQRVSQSPDSPRFDHQWSVQFPREESRLTPYEQNDALNKLKKETYHPTHKRVSKMPNLYYRNYDTSNIKQSHNNQTSDEDGTRCSICLEDFEPKEVVTVTPCKHMFHEDCIVPWVKNHGRCPVCRFAIYEKSSGNNNVASSNNATADDAFERDMVSMIRAIERRGVLLP